MNNFVKFAAQRSPEVAAVLGRAKPGSAEFDRGWKQLASRDPQGFERLQHEFIQATHYAPVAEKVSAMGVNLNQRSQALQDVIWSTAVQHGVGGAEKVLRAAIGKNPNMSDAELIQRIYAERGANGGMKYFPSSSSKIRQSVLNRFQSEMREALSML